ncbi:MAG: NADH-ubiquinone oxidoreductase-F iron-sulfur binding region domain-containing protein [Dehalococcoidia bacterium]
MMEEHQTQQILLPDETPVDSLEAYRARGGGEALARVVSMEPAAVIDEVRRAGLRGRGGAGFPTAVKWQGVQRDPAAVRYVCCNGAEGEPGTFKDRWLLRLNPYQVVEGLAIAAHVLGARTAYLCVKRLFEQEIAAVRRALDEMRGAGLVGDAIEIVLGPDEYLFGEEKALLEVVEGGLPLPRVFPPYIHGLFTGAYGGPPGQNNPTVVNNVETLAHVPSILRHGADWFRRFGTANTPGTMVFTVSGDIQRPVVAERPLGLSLRDLIEGVAGGPPPGRRVKAVFPGLANAVITPDLLDTPLDFDAMRRAGVALGSGGFIVYADDICMAQMAAIFARFLFVESCNQCPPCKLGGRTISERLDRLLAGAAEPSDLDEIYAATTWVTNSARCFLATSQSVVTASILNAFPEDFQAHLAGRCPLRHDRILPKMTDYVPGQGFRYDETYASKQPDWTYDVPTGESTPR